MSQKRGVFFPLIRITAFFFFLCLLFFAGCSAPVEKEEPDPQAQEEFLKWAKPLYQEIQRSDQLWVSFSKALVFYVDGQEEKETLKDLAAESITLHNELLDTFSASGKNEAQKKLSELSYKLSLSRLRASEIVLEELQKNEIPDINHEIFREIRDNTRQLALSFEEMLREHGLVWAHLK